MNNKLYFIIIGLLFLLTGCTQDTITGDVVTPAQQESYIGVTVSSGTLEQGDVRIDITPIKKTENTLWFEVNANTHSVALHEFDLRNQLTLLINGNTLQPASADSLGGHHAKSVVSFNLDMPVNDPFSLLLTGIPKNKERLFEW